MQPHETEVANHNRYRFRQSVWPGGWTHSAVDSRAQSHHRMEYRWATACVSGEAVSARQRRAGVEDQALGSSIRMAGSASLALQDAGIDLSQVDCSRVAVVFATVFGCIELTEAFYQSAFNNWLVGKTDPITFPETLANSPAGHVALLHNLRGPNITVSSKNFAGESVSPTAASLLRHGQADLAVVIAGDTLSQTMYEWYETANLLSPACFKADTQPEASGYVPSEGVVAMVLEPAGKRSARSYAYLQAGRWAAGGDPLTKIREMLGSSVPRLIITAGNGGPCATSSSNER